MTESSNVRRLPIYLLCDTSSSMAGKSMDCVRNGIRMMLTDIKSNPQALETAAMSIITFDNSARQIMPLTDLPQVTEPVFTPDGMTAMGNALRLLADCIDREVRLSSPTQKGDWKPLVFLLTDGEPSDDWKTAADALKAKRINLVACAVPGANTATLRQITECVVQIDTVESLASFFKWVSASVKVASRSLNQGGNQVGLPKPPAEIKIVL